MKYLIAALIIVHTITSGLSQPTPSKFIEVTGFAEKEILADYLEISVNVKESDNLKKDNDFALREKNVLESLNEIGVAKEDIRVDNFDVYRYGISNSSNRYTLSKTYLVKVRNMESINEFTIRLFEAGANDVSIVRRVKNDLEKYKVEAVKEAVENARTRATQIATTLNISIGQPIQVVEAREKDLEPITNRDTWYGYNKLSNAQSIPRAQSEFQAFDGGPDADIRKMKVTYRVIIQFEIIK